MMGYYYGNMGGFGFIFMLLFWGLIIWAVVALVGGRGHCGGVSNSIHGHREENDAMDILKQRYAKGEITKEDFERMKKDLQ